MTMPKNKKILEEIHPLNIIKEVQKWPVLYEKDNPERSNYHFKTKVWKEVAKNLIPDWEELSDIQKEIKASGLSKKWRNLRDSFRRQLEAERRAQRTGGAEGPRRPYVYFKYMSFLLPHVATPSDTGDVIDVTPPEPHHTPHAPEPIRPKKRKRKLPEVCSLPKVEKIDEDRHFLLSLIPSFKKMTDNEKLTAKVEILKVIQQIRSSSPSIEFRSADVFIPEDTATSSGGVKLELIPEEEASYSDSDDDEDLIT